MNYKIYNKSAEDMSEVEENSIDLIIGSPPYNIGTVYGNNKDVMSFFEYKKMLNKIFTECYRVLKNEGTFLLEASDSIMTDGLYVQLSGLVQSICLDIGFNLKTRHINFVNTKNGVELKEDSRWGDDYSTKNNAHSNCHQWLVFVKKEINFENGEIFYFNYIETPEHPCPTPQESCNTFLSKYYTEGMIVLEPFMGTAVLGENVIKRNGKYIGYEIDEKIFNETKRKLSKYNISA